jgi:hypothetical protein
MKGMKMLQRMRVLDEKGEAFATVALKDLPIIGARRQRGRGQGAGGAQEAACGAIDAEPPGAESLYNAKASSQAALSQQPPAGAPAGPPPTTPTQHRHPALRHLSQDSPHPEGPAPLVPGPTQSAALHAAAPRHPIPRHPGGDGDFYHLEQGGIPLKDVVLHGLLAPTLRAEAVAAAYANSTPGRASSGGGAAADTAAAAAAAPATAAARERSTGGGSMARTGSSASLGSAAAGAAALKLSPARLPSARWGLTAPNCSQLLPTAPNCSQLLPAAEEVEPRPPARARARTHAHARRSLLAVAPRQRPALCRGCTWLAPRPPPHITGHPHLTRSPDSAKTSRLVPVVHRLALYDDKENIVNIISQTDIVK